MLTNNLIAKITLAVAPLLLQACASSMAERETIVPLESRANWEISEPARLSAQFFSFEDNQELQQYLTSVLSNNPDLNAIAATARATVYSTGIASAESKPKIDLNLERTRQKDMATKIVSNSASVSLNISWAVDIWGRLSDVTKAAVFSVNQANYELQHAKQVLGAQATNAWIDYWSYSYAKNNSNQLMTLYTDLTAHYHDNYAAGLASYRSYIEVKNKLKYYQNQTEELGLNLLKQRHKMNILRGLPPAEDLVITSGHIPLPLIGSSQSIPATALANRPDLRAKFALLKSSDHSAFSAHKALLPQITLTGSGLRNAASFDKAFRADTIWQLIGGLTQPLFNSGQLSAIAEQKSAEAEANWWSYQGSVLLALLEVEDILAEDQYITQRLERQKNLLDDLGRQVLSKQERYLESNLSLTDYLLTQAEALEAKIELNLIESRYIKNRISLLIALGLPISISNKDEHDKT